MSKPALSHPQCRQPSPDTADQRFCLAVGDNHSAQWLRRQCLAATVTGLYRFGPVLFITAHGDVPMAVETMKKGALDFIQKPFDEEELVGLVERMLDHARESFAGYQQAASRRQILLISDSALPSAITTPRSG